MNRKKAALHNLGCKVNAYELEAMQELLEQADYEIVPFAEGADVYVVNTCTVTNIADRKSRQMLHRAKKLNPRAVVVAAGCYAQTGRETLEADAAVDIVLGNDRKQELVTALEDFFRLRQDGEENTLSFVTDISRRREYETLSIRSTADRVRAYIKITDGCNQFCSYCLIPFARGRVRSRGPEEILKEIRVLSEGGFREVVLTGIHISSYGTDFSDEKTDLLSLIRQVGEIPGIQRIRLGSLEPGIITEEFAAGLAAVPEVCPHFHLSLQSGCDATLRRMNRRYTAREYAAKCEILRRHFRNPALTTDVIVGFPGETEEEYQASRAFIEGIRFYETHVFPYSRRDGTRAAAMPDQVEEPVKDRRAAELIGLGKENIRRFEHSMYGRTLQVLLEEGKEVGGSLYLTGHSREYIPCAVPADGAHQPGDIVQLPITGHLGEHLLC